jgi:type VI secretion system protein ImpL
MKRISSLTIVLWIALFVVGLGCALLGVFFPSVLFLCLIIAIVIWVADAVWAAIVIVRKVRAGAQKRGAALIGNQAVFLRVLRETEEAVARYLSSVNRQGLLKRSALNDRPWFLLCGVPKAGKSSLLRGSGLSFPVTYPSERDGAIVEGGNQVRWYFGNEAVWIDTPGLYMEESGKDEWQALVDALQKVRPDCPASGVALVVNVSEVLNADDLRIKELAQRLRGRLDDLIARWGIEFPVYLLFNHADEIPGFNEYFSDQIASGEDQIFGATISPKSSEGLTPRMVFAEEFNILSKSLSEFRLDRLYKEPSGVRKRMICRFVIHFQGIQQKLGVLAAELFKPSSYVGKPIFRGFYFTSCSEREVSAGAAAEAASRAPDVGATIVNHPFNPHRSLGITPKNAPASVAKKESKSFFVLPLFREIMAHDRPLVKATHIRSRQTMIRRLALLGAIGVAGLALVAYLVSGYMRIEKFYGQVETSLANLPPETAPIFDQYAALDEMQGAMGKLQKYDDHVPLSMGIGLYRGKPLLQALKRSYFVRLHRCMIAPAVKFLEYDIRNHTESFGELSGEDYDKLYRSLKAYLSISEAAANHPGDIDTVTLRPVLFDAIKQSILSSINATNLPEKVETVLQGNMGLLLTYLRRGEFPAIQENQRLVADSRSRLRRLPNAEALYEGVMGRLLPSASPIGLTELIGAQAAGGVLATTKTVSALYTQDGWDQSVQAALKEAAQNPYRVDWVIGLTKDDVPEASIDKRKLFDEMEVAYINDFQKQWCEFLGSVTMEPFNGLPQSSRILQKLVGDESELLKLLEAVGKSSQLKSQSLAEKSGALLNAVSRVKAVAGAARAVNGAARSVSFNRNGATPFDDLTATFDALRAFSASSSGSLSGYAGYKEKMLLLVDKLNSIESGGENQIVAVFTGRDDDPFYAAWKYTKAAVGLMPEQLAAGLGNLLLKPLTLTGISASEALTRALNARWQSEVVKPFASRFAGRYPFSARGEDASWTDVMDYFRPTTGTYWGFYERVLSPYVVKTPSGWMVRQLGGLQLSFNPDLSASLTDADIIRNIFFKPDGTVRTLDMTIQPATSNKTSAKLEVDGQSADLLPGGKSARVSWPLEGQGRAQGASLKIQASKDFWQDITFNGSWGFLKLINAAKVNKSNGSTFSAKWQINVQNMYMLYFDARIQVAASDHPFTEPVFQRFNCPLALIVTAK